MTSSIDRVLRKVRARAEARRQRALDRAKARIEFDPTHGGSIWRSGKGGTPHPG